MTFLGTSASKHSAQSKIFHVTLQLRNFQKKEMMPFPQSKKGDHNNYFPGREIELFCSCQMPETYDDMIQCDTCEDWYHLKCVGLKKFL